MFTIKHPTHMTFRPAISDGVEVKTIQFSTSSFVCSSLGYSPGCSGFLILNLNLKFNLEWISETVLLTSVENIYAYCQEIKLHLITLSDMTQAVLRQLYQAASLRHSPTIPSYH